MREEVDYPAANVRETTVNVAELIDIESCFFGDIAERNSHFNFLQYVIERNLGDLSQSYRHHEVSERDVRVCVEFGLQLCSRANIGERLEQAKHSISSNT